MKSSIAILALASVGEATFNFNFRGAKPFTCPENVDNTCVENQKNGFDFKELFPGSFSKYNDFDFKGWSCEDKFNKRTIKGECGPTKEESPSFGCTDKTFSVDHIEVTPEEDTDLEFHYDMPDGSSCKTRSSCSRQGTTVKNNQCGGAKKVTIVYPPKKNKSKCKIDIGKIGFGCDKTKFPPPPPVYPPPSAPAPSTLSTIFSSVPATTASSTAPVFSQPPVESSPPVVVVPSSSAPVVPVSSAPASSAPASSAPVVSEPASSAPPLETSPAVSSSAVESTTTEAIPVESVPVESEPVQSEPVVTKPGYSQPPPVVSVPASSAPPAITSSAAESTSTGVIPVQSQPVSSQPPVISEPPVVDTTTFQSTSTIFTTSVTTITDCGPEHPDCGSQETPVVVTVTIPQTTTVCDVTSTFTRPAVPTTEKPALPQTTAPVTPETPVTPDTPETPEEPVTELPCNPVVPRCLITWLPLVPDCKDNTDAKCFCPKKEFIEKVFECLYAYGDNDEVVDEALKFVQGICADHVNENPAVVTGAETITKILTLPAVTATATSVAYTTITLDATLTVPCVEDGTTIPNSMTTTVVKSTIEVPKVEFATTASDIVPVVPTAIPIQEGEAEGNSPTLIVAPSSTPAGTGGIVPVPTSGLPVAAGAGKLSAGVTAAVAVMVAMIAF